MIQLRAYRVFAAAVEEGSLSAAARRLDISVAAVSKHVSALEAEVDTQLLERTATGVRPTELGDVFFEHCRETLNSVESVRERLQEERQALSGRISITMSRSLAGATVFRCLADYAKQHPGILFDLRFEESLQNLVEADIDFALRVGRADDRQQDVSILLRSVRPVLVSAGSVTNGETNGKAGTRSARLYPVFTAPNTLSTAVRRKLGQHPLLAATEQTHTANDLQGVLHAIRAGLGIGVLLDIAVESGLDNGDLVDLSAGDPLPKKSLYLVYSRGRPLLRRHQSFKQHVIDTLKLGAPKQ